MPVAFDPAGLGLPDGERPLVVRAGFHLHDINAIDDDTETFELNGVLTLDWRDPRLAFDPGDSGADERVYQGDFQDEREAETIETALRIYDHEILNTAVDRALPLIDLRRVCTEPEDYWNPIEPSERGGEKIAEAVLGAVRVPGVAVNGGLVTLQGVSGLAR